MSIDKNLVKSNFSAASYDYDNYATIQKEMAKRLFKMANKHNKILEIGCGTGYFTKLLSKISSDITACDISQNMADMAKKRVDCAKFIVADGECLAISGFDLIASNATFQWFNNLQSSIESYYNMLNKDGVLLFSTFGKETFNELHKSFNSSENCSKKIGQEFKDISEIKDILSSCGFVGIEVKSMSKRFYFNSLKELLESIKGVGASNAIDGGYMGKSCYKDFINYYKTVFVDNKKVYCTYETIYVKARRVD